MEQKRSYKFPEKFTQSIEQLLAARKHSLSQPKKLADSVLKLSDVYTGKSKFGDIWSSINHQAAYLAYFLPLNYLRLRAVFDEVQRLQFFCKNQSVVDFGSGLGTTQMAMEDTGIHDFSLHCIESSNKAKDLHRQLIQSVDIKIEPEWIQNPPMRKSQVGVFSYSLNEVDSLPNWALDFESLVIVEPSTQTAGRKLSQLRDRLIEQGYFAWAPCTHQQNCPMIKESKKDWCHDRIFVEMPDWFRKLEEHLPMKNRSVTFSYLLLKNTPPPTVSDKVARVIGDTQKEKGKTKQMICRGPKREFLSWLKREGEPPHLPRGSMIELSEAIEAKGQELRTKGVRLLGH